MTYIKKSKDVVEKASRDPIRKEDIDLYLKRSNLFLETAKKEEIERERRMLLSISEAYREMAERALNLIEKEDKDGYL